MVRYKLYTECREQLTLDGTVLYALLFKLYIRKISKKSFK